MSTLLTKENFNKCEICAYHESGHILFAYLCGYTCTYVELINDKNEEDFTSIAIINYGKDEHVASLFVGPHANLDVFKSFDLATRMESVEVGRRIARIFLGGSVAAAVFNNKGDVHIPLPMQIDFTDLLRVEFIQRVLKELSTDTDENFIEHNLQDALYTLGNINVWNTVEDLAKRLMQYNQLNKNDIEECLEEHGIFYDASQVDNDFATNSSQ
jgi:hypothetical protein